MVSRFSEICCGEYNFGENKDIFLKNTFNAEKTPSELKEFYGKNKERLKGCPNLEKFLVILQKNGLLYCYQKFFLHNSLATIRQARLIAEQICQESEENIPPGIHKLIALIAEFCEGKLHGDTGDVIRINDSKIAKVIQTSPFILEIFNG